MWARLQSQVVDVGMCKIVSASADRDIEFSRQVGPLWVTTGVGDGIKTDQIVDSVTQFACINHFLIVDSSKRAAHHVSDTVQCGLERCLVSGMKTIDDIGGIFDFDTTELDVRTCRDVNDTYIPVFFDAIGVKPHLIGIYNSVRNLEAHHKLAGGSLVSVQHANIFDTRVDIGLFHIFPCHFPLTDFSGVFVDVNPCVDGIPLKFYLLGGISLFTSFYGFLGEKGSSRWLINDDGTLYTGFLLDSAVEAAGW
mmetsp:Transcript_27936/g.59817  ORF Transcript_27936/g.59817 Transcript_27936/m.59817 type:complete len:252 (+) Transcript_27936:5234-5989(+)